MSSWAERRAAWSVVAVALAVAVAGAAAPATAQTKAPPGRYGIGTPATPQQIAGWDIDVRPDGHGLKKGSGTVTQGQDLYDAQCASCHGTFGESTRFLVLAGGVKAADLKTGRASSLRIAGIGRTLGNKLNAASTLWDYINRAMPWTAPQSLTVDEVYALTAYVLYLNEIVPADFELSDRNILTLPMPNRNGFTNAHGMGSVQGKPDVQGDSCMKNCKAPLKVTSYLPEFARNAHGNLREQMRPIGAVAGIDTLRHEQTATRGQATTATSARAANDADPHELFRKNGCGACHAVDDRIVGPAFKEVAGRYAQRADAERYLAGKIRFGGVGIWGQVPMPAQPGLKDHEVKALASWILAGAR